jgi:hypothetical protein
VLIRLERILLFFIYLFCDRLCADGDTPTLTQKEAGNWLARRESKKKKNKTYVIEELAAIFFFFLPFCRNDPQARNHPRRNSGTDILYVIYSKCKGDALAWLNQPTHTHTQQKESQYPTRHDGLFCCWSARLFLAHEFSLIYYTLTCFDGRARNWEKLANGEKKNAGSACMCVCVCVCQCGWR